MCLQGVQVVISLFPAYQEGLLCKEYVSALRITAWYVVREVVGKCSGEVLLIYFIPGPRPPPPPRPPPRLQKTCLQQVVKRGAKRYALVRVGKTQIPPNGGWICYIYDYSQKKSWNPKFKEFCIYEKGQTFTRKVRITLPNKLPPGARLRPGAGIRKKVTRRRRPVSRRRLPGKKGKSASLLGVQEGRVSRRPGRKEVADQARSVRDEAWRSMLQEARTAHDEV